MTPSGKIGTFLSSQNMSVKINITVNGQTEEVAGNSSISALINQLNLQGKPVIIELNKEALAASEHNLTTLSQGDCLEILVLGAGG